MLIWIAVIGAWLGTFEMSTVGYGATGRSASSDKPVDDAE